jgi:hypothetical protein
MVCGWNFQLFSSRHRELIILGNNNIMSMSFFVFEKKESKGDNQIVDYEIFYIIFKGKLFNYAHNFWTKHFYFFMLTVSANQSNFRP